MGRWCNGGCNMFLDAGNLFCKLVVVSIFHSHFFIFETKKDPEYPLVTHDPNMLKKVTGELSWKIKVSLTEGKYENFRQKQFTLVHRVCIFPKYFTTNCDAVSPFFISKTKNNSPLKSHHFIFPVPFRSCDYTLSCSSFNNYFLRQT